MVVFSGTVYVMQWPECSSYKIYFPPKVIQNNYKRVDTIVQNIFKGKNIDEEFFQVQKRS
jgi:hypothetical protein